MVPGERLMQAASDIFLGWQHVDAGADGQARDFYIRQLRHRKFSIEIESPRPEGLQMYGQLCGWTLARAHARSGDRIAIAAYLGNSDVFDRAITKFAAAYADQNERDYRQRDRLALFRDALRLIAAGSAPARNADKRLCGMTVAPRIPSARYSIWLIGEDVGGRREAAQHRTPVPDRPWRSAPRKQAAITPSIATTNASIQRNPNACNARI